MLEVIAKNFWDVLKINRSQADRIELCRDLAVGGLTPSRLTIWLSTHFSKVPINVMLRPSARSFDCDESEFNQMLKQAKFIAKTKANGVVLGILNADNEIDLERMQQVVNLLPNKKLTFHKAFDETIDLTKSLSHLNALKIDSVLTSGGRGKIEDNLTVLKDLKDQKKVIIIGGGGVNTNNLLQLQPVVNELHIGREARREASWKYSIDRWKINDFSRQLNQQEN